MNANEPLSPNPSVGLSPSAVLPAIALGVFAPAAPTTVAPVAPGPVIAVPAPAVPAPAVPNTVTPAPIVLANSKLIQIVRRFCQLLIDEEAVAICGAELRERTDKRLNYQMGRYYRMLHLCGNSVQVRVPSFRYKYMRPSMLKRFQRLDVVLVAGITECLENFPSAEKLTQLIKIFWTFGLPADRLARLTEKSLILIAHCKTAKKP